MVYYYSEQQSFGVTESNVVKINNLEEICDALSEETTICVDCETNGLNPLENKVLMVQLGTLKDQYVIDVRGVDFGKHFKKLLENPKITFVGHNLKFDYNMFKQFGIVMDNIYDTMLAEMVIFNDKYSPVYRMKNKRFSLAGVYKHYFDTYIPKTVRDEFQHWGSKPFTLEQIMYGAKDVEYPLLIKEAQAHWIAKYDLELAVSLENKSVLAVGDIEYNGFYISSPKWLKAYEDYKIKLDESLKELDQILIKHAPRYEIKSFQLSLFGDVERKRYTGVNWGSSAQVLKILQEEFDIHPQDKHGKATSETKTLLKLDDKPPIIEALLKNRKYSKVVSSFGKEFLNQHLHKDGRLRSSFNQIVGTGRMSSRNPNMQQIPSGKEFRGAFIAPNGKKLITADYSNQEGRIMADMSGDESYIDFFNNGDGDAHSFVATTMFSAAFGREFIVTATNENKEYRQKGKVLNFMISFGGSAFTLSKDLKISIKEAENLIDAFYKGFPGLKIMFDKGKKQALRDGFVRTNSVTNRIRWIPEWDEYNALNSKKHYELTKEEMSQKGVLKGRIERKGMNTPVQGTAGDMTKTALILARKKLLAEGIRPLADADIKLVQVVHDEIVIEATDGHESKGADILKESMEKAGTFYCSHVNMSASPVIGQVWDH